MKNNQEIEDFESLLASQGNSDIKYNVDTDMESLVKYDYLVEVYGKDLVDSVVHKKNELFDPEYYRTVLLELKNIGM
jgi:hypothetical protein